MFAGPRRPCWATRWATRPTQRVQGAVNLTTNPCKSQWARLGSNQRPLACEASALPLSYAPLCTANQRYFAALRVSPNARSFRAISGNSCDEIARITEMIRAVELTRWMLSSTSNRPN
jgi:hypothetical protein